MPELPEVETARRLLHEALTGRTLGEVRITDDPIVFRKVSPGTLGARLLGQSVTGTGRKGKFMWIELDAGSLMLHLGMSGAILELTPGRERSVHYVSGKHEVVPEQEPRFLKLRIRTDSGQDVALVDGRRLARIWWTEDPNQDAQVRALGSDALTALPTAWEFQAMLAKRRAPIKALLLDQSLVSGLGNYLADEILFHAGIAPQRPGGQLSEAEVELLLRKTQEILSIAVSAGAEATRYPPEWLFHVRWGGKRGERSLQGLAVVRETIGGRTTAWVPERQR